MMHAEEEVYLCEPEQGSILDESSDEDEAMRQAKGFMDPWKDENPLRELMFGTTKEAMDPYDFETNDYCMFVGFSRMRDDRQSSNTILNQENKMTIPSHIRDLKKNYGQMKKDVQLKDIQNTSQKGKDKELVDIRERLGKLEIFKAPADWSSSGPELVSFERRE